MTSLLFFTAFLGIFALLNMYISKRFIQKLNVSVKVQVFMRFFLVLNFLGIIFYILGRYYIEYPHWLYFLLSLPVGILFLLFCVAVMYDVSRVFLNSIPMSDGRRGFFKKSLDLSGLVLATSLSARAIYEARHLVLEKVEVQIKNLHRSYTIAQISDVHIGGLINVEFIESMVNKVNLIKPDVVVITGDLIDISLDKAQPSLLKLKNLESKYGTFFILGNHEYFHGVEGIITYVKSLGIRVLENENIYIGDEGRGFNLAGVYDVMGYRTQTYIPDLQQALREKKDAPTVLLAHQPRFIEEVKSGVDLMLSGHTHGGQIYPFHFLVKLIQPYISGLHQHNKDLQIYVNKGTGFWGPPMRLGASSEITEIVLSPNQTLSKI
ncbi:MAG: metallophosphoesterase [Sulfurimonas sp.]|nr:MAG: metallophosphoesterase [Sulfurimonas sp.]